MNKQHGTWWYVIFLGQAGYNYYMVHFISYGNVLVVINYSALFLANACVKTQVPLHCWLRNFYSGEYLTLLLLVVREGDADRAVHVVSC